MTSQVITLALEGSPTIDDYSMALGSLRELLRTLGSRVAQGVTISWVIESLVSGSAETVLRGEARDTSAVERVADAYLKVGTAFAFGDQAAILDWNVDKPVIQLRNILNGRVPSIRFETADDAVTITSGPTAVAQPATPTRFPNDHGAVEGRIQTLSSRSKLTFTLYDLVRDRPVQCYLSADQQDLVRDMWDHLAVVEGRVKRDPLNGRPTSVRQIRRLTLIEPVDENAWRSAHGVVSAAEPAESIIRRLRDAK